ncbi:hypothetical protein WS71_21800 [Burkholderia mayonis]|uniref:Uncharacterized protein n=1 Tax=Burkholderia mayonis TaxID=1385591 RepID=A0A1B4G1V9_9BURK|nr:hypothetical protein WS71_21800 [Burkholderia mayonis]KVE46974.1 hypothetical protein WS71_20000 [Burkholderia mayonis]
MAISATNAASRTAFGTRAPRRRQYPMTMMKTALVSISARPKIRLRRYPSAASRSVARVLTP